MSTADLTAPMLGSWIAAQVPLLESAFGDVIAVERHEFSALSDGMTLLTVSDPQGEGATGAVTYRVMRSLSRMNGLPPRYLDVVIPHNYRRGQTLLDSMYMDVSDAGIALKSADPDPHLAQALAAGRSPLERGVRVLVRGKYRLAPSAFFRRKMYGVPYAGAGTEGFQHRPSPWR